MKRGRVVLLVLFLILVSSFALAVEKECVYYFYGEGDSKSEATGIFLEKLQLKYAGLQLHNFEVYYDKTNLKLLQDYLDAYGVPVEKQGVPIVFLPQSYFVGERPIIEYLENTIISNRNLLCPSLTQGEVLGIIGEKSPKHLIETLTFFTVTGAAISDSVDASALAVLLVLLGLLLVMEKKKIIMKGGPSFIAGVFLAYFLLGTGVLGTFTKGNYFHVVISSLAIVLGLTILWYFWKGKIFLKEIQGKKKLGTTMKGMISSPTVFLIGFTLSLFGFSSVRKYFSIITNLFAENSTRWAAMTLLLYYSVIFILPLVAVTLAAYFVTNKMGEKKGTKKKNQWNIKLLHLIAGLIMVFLGAIILFLF